MGSSPQLIQVGAVFDGAQLKTAITSTAATVEQSTQAMAASFEKVNTSSHVAMAGMAFAVEDTGIKVSRHFRHMLAEIPLVNQAFSALMPVFALGVGIDILGRAVEKVVELSTEYERLSESAKKSMDEIGNETKKLIASDEKLLAIRRNTELVGKSTVEQARLRAHWAAEDARETGAATEELLKQYNAAKLIVAAHEQDVAIKLHVIKKSDIDPTLIAPKDSDLQAALKQIEILEAAYGKGLSELQQKSIEQREKGKEDEAKANQATLQNSIAVNLAKIEVGKKTADAIIVQETQAIKELESAHKISVEDALTLNKSLIDKKYQQDETALRAKLAQLQRDPALNAKQIIAVQGEIRTVTIQHYSELEKLDAEYYKQVEHNGQEAVNKAAAKLHEMVHQVQAAQQIILESAKAHEQAIGQLLDQRLAFELQIGKITEANYEKQLQASLAATYRNERAKLELKRQAAHGNLAEQAKVDGELKKLDDKYYAESEKAEQQSFLRRRQKFDQYFQQVSQSFNTALNSWIQGTQTAGQAFSQMFNQIILELLSFVERWIEKKIEMWLIDKILGDSGQQAQVDNVAASNAAMATSDAFLAAANAYAPLAWDPPAAASAAAFASGVVGAFAIGAGAVAAFAQGTNFVPQDGLAYLHKGEEIIPANKQGQGHSGSGGGDVHVHVNLSAVDADSFKGHIRRHGNMIGEEVARVLKRKGLK